MFGIARWVVRHKVGATAVVALGVFFLSPGQEDEQPQQSNSPWAQQAAPSNRVMASNEETGFIDDMMDEAVAYLDETGMNPMEKADETVGRFDDTAAAYERVNSRN